MPRLSVLVLMRPPARSAGSPAHSYFPNCPSRRFRLVGRHAFRRAPAGRRCAAGGSRAAPRRGRDPHERALQDLLAHARGQRPAACFHLVGFAEPALRGSAWPAPHRFEDSAGASIGYKQRVVLPLLVTPENPRLPVKLVLSLDYAVCEQVCIPARGEVKLELTASAMSAPQSAVIEEALSQVPPAGCAVRRLRARRALGHGGWRRPRLIITAQTPPTRGLVDIFTEGPEAGPSPLRSPSPLSRAARFASGDLQGHRRFPPDGQTLHGLALSLTMAAGEAAVEIKTHLDGKAAPH